MKYRILKRGEKIKVGDECRLGGKWYPIIGFKVNIGQYYRRPQKRLKVAKRATNTASLPCPHFHKKTTCWFKWSIECKLTACKLTRQA
jgi:hypothetical protein